MKIPCLGINGVYKVITALQSREGAKGRRSLEKASSIRMADRSSGPRPDPDEEVRADAIALLMANLFDAHI